MWTEWKTKFLQIVDKHAPMRIKRVRSRNCSLITAGLKECMHNRDTLKINGIMSNDLHDWHMHNRDTLKIKAIMSNDLHDWARLGQLGLTWAK